MGILWLRFLKEVGEKTQEVDVEFLNQPELSKALELSQESAYSKAELEAYDKYWDAISNQKTYIHDSFERGLQEGLERGVFEGKKAIARQMLNDSFSIEMIEKITGLTKTKIEKL